MKRSLILISTTLIFLAFSNILQAQDISGTWYNTEKSGKIKIFKESASHQCGYAKNKDKLHNNGLRSQFGQFFDFHHF